MGLSDWMRRMGSGRSCANSKSPSQAQAPCFEQLEPRILLSANCLPAIPLDPLHSSSDLAPAIDVDLEYGQEQPVSALESTLTTGTANDEVDLVILDSEDEHDEAQKDSDTSLTRPTNSNIKLSELLAKAVQVNPPLGTL